MFGWRLFLTRSVIDQQTPLESHKQPNFSCHERKSALIKIGYALSSEEHEPNQLVTNAGMAEQVGFNFLLISDHFHPWLSRQGQSSFVWSVLGGIAHATHRVSVGTGVTCPIIRFHPALTAQAAATVAAMMPGRFFLGLGTGEYLNEHIFGDAWPPSRPARKCWKRPSM